MALPWISVGGAVCSMPQEGEENALLLREWWAWITLRGLPYPTHVSTRDLEVRSNSTYCVLHMYITSRFMIYFHHSLHSQASPMHLLALVEIKGSW